MLGGCESEEKSSIYSSRFSNTLGGSPCHQQMQKQKVELEGGCLPKMNRTFFDSYSVTFFRHHKQCTCVYIYMSIYIYMYINIYIYEDSIQKNIHMYIYIHLIITCMHMISILSPKESGILSTLPSTPSLTERRYVVCFQPWDYGTARYTEWVFSAPHTPNNEACGFP